ncbi:MAG: DUF2752 domain-containing protein [bacterium]
MKAREILRRINLEAIIWIAALIYLIVINPFGSGHLDLCFFHLVGIENCPGCGLGKSVSFLFHGDLVNSLEMHPLGIIAAVLILHRIVSLFNEQNKFNINEVKNG